MSGGGVLMHLLMYALMNASLSGVNPGHARAPEVTKRVDELESRVGSRGVPAQGVLPRPDFLAPSARAVGAEAWLACNCSTHSKVST